MCVTERERLHFYEMIPFKSVVSMIVEMHNSTALESCEHIPHWQPVTLEVSMKFRKMKLKILDCVLKCLL